MARSNLLPNVVSFAGWLRDVENMGESPGAGLKVFARLEIPQPKNHKGVQRPSIIPPIVAYGKKAQMLLDAEPGDTIHITGRVVYVDGAVRLAADTIHNMDMEL